DNPARLNIVSDIVDHTIAAVQWGEALGGWTALGEAEIFELEYWELEQAKLKRMPAPATLTGKVAVVTGGASGIGAACVEAFRGRGAVVVALDIDPSITGLAGADVHGIHCDVLDAQAVRDALQEAAGHFGGVDILVSNAGNFPKSEPIDSLDEQNLRASLALNFESHATLVRACLPFLKRGFDPAVLLVASKNVPAPGPGAAAYSAAKAALTQFGRVAALELGEHGIRVNTVHPNAVFDTALWSQETIASRAAAYGVTPEAYRRNNVLRTEVSSADVARLLVEIAGPAFAKTTGAQVPVDGGNERVI
ncbi:MAG: SDR family oxidoreductase, partial [Pseudomonadales bacterium]|nr:SDR family oxidoreductase [Pseudomonadales bacterium]